MYIHAYQYFSLLNKFSHFMMSNLEELNRHLSKTRKPYLNLEPIGTQSVRLRFVGRFNNQDVVWDANFITLEKYYHEYLRTSNNTTDDSVELQQFIEIHENGENGMSLTVGLNVEKFDEPTILKAVIMIQNYKRLQHGRHNFGQPYRFPRK